jgi:hypothetical protein
MLRQPRTAVALVLIGLAGCRPEAGPAPEEQPVRNETADKAPIALPQPERPLDREGVLIAAIRARSAAAAGADDRAAQAELDGKRFEFRIVLGCNLAAAGQAGADAIYDAERRRVELSVRPDAALTDPAVAAAAGGGYEAAEGFWVAEPWLLVPHCVGAAPPVETGPAPADGEAAPAGAADAATPAGAADAAAMRAGGVALVQYFTPAEPRSQRRNGRPYAAGQTLAEGSAAPEPGSWQLVLSGRLQALGQSGKVIACQPVGPGAAPACTISVRFDRVAIENRTSGERLAEWGGR